MSWWEADPIVGTLVVKPAWYHGWIVPHIWRTAKCGCNAKNPDEKLPIYRWLGVEWYGYPKPLKWRREPKDGCGCIVRLKQAWRELQLWFTYTYGELSW